MHEHCPNILTTRLKNAWTLSLNSNHGIKRRCRICVCCLCTVQPRLTLKLEKKRTKTIEKIMFPNRPLALIFSSAVSCWTFWATFQPRTTLKRETNPTKAKKLWQKSCFQIVLSSSYFHAPSRAEHFETARSDAQIQDKYYKNRLCLQSNFAYFLTTRLKYAWTLSPNFNHAVKVYMHIVPRF